MNDENQPNRHLLLPRFHAHSRFVARHCVQTVRRLNPLKPVKRMLQLKIHFSRQFLNFIERITILITCITFSYDNLSYRLLTIVFLFWFTIYSIFAIIFLNNALTIL